LVVVDIFSGTEEMGISYFYAPNKYDASNEKTNNNANGNFKGD
jgi:hypothetical protein